MTNDPNGNTPPICIWELPLSVIRDVLPSKEPEFPAVRIVIDKPSSFSRGNTFKQLKLSPGGAADTELVIIGSAHGESDPRALVMFHVESHQKSLLVSRLVDNIIGRSSPLRLREETIHVKRRLGFSIGPIPRQMRDHLLAKVPHQGGAGVVLRVEKPSLAHSSGLKEGDIVLSCNGQSLDLQNPRNTIKKISSESEGALTFKIKRAPDKILNITI